MKTGKVSDTVLGHDKTVLYLLVRMYVCMYEFTQCTVMPYTMDALSYPSLLCRYIIATGWDRKIHLFPVSIQRVYLRKTCCYLTALNMFVFCYSCYRICQEDMFIISLSLLKAGATTL